MEDVQRDHRYHDRHAVQHIEQSLALDDRACPAVVELNRTVDRATSIALVRNQVPMQEGGIPNVDEERADAEANEHDMGFVVRVRARSDGTVVAFCLIGAGGEGALVV